MKHSNRSVLSPGPSFLIFRQSSLWLSLATGSLLVLAGCSSIFIPPPSTPDAPNSQQVPEPSSAQEAGSEAALARHLKQIGATMYGTFWCPYCKRQKAMFGEAVSELTIIECDPQGQNAQPDRCAQAQVSSYPTWEINGQLYRGMLSLENLADLSGYNGSRNFGR